MKNKRILSFVLCIAMLCSIFAVGTISASAEESELVTKVLYDFEGDVLPEGITYAKMQSDRTGISDMQAYTGTQSFSFVNATAVWNLREKNVGADTMTKSYVRMAIPTDINVVGDVGFAFNSTTQHSSSYQAFGVEMADGTYYFTKYRNVTQDVWHIINMMNETFYKLDDNAVTKQVTTEEFAADAENRVVALIIADGGTTDAKDELRSYIDDVFYETVEETTTSAPKATFDNGVADVEADSDGNVTMPTATIEGKQLLGWQTADGALYAAGAKVAITEDTAFTAVAADIALQTGAGIRWAEKESERGIRFETYVTKAAIDSIGSSSFELGALILPYNKYNAEITVDTATNYGAINVVDPKVYGETADGNYRYYCGVVDFERYFAVSQAAMADLKLTAVSYIKVTYADSTVGYFYDHPDATNNVRSVAEVARAALADTEFGYTDKQKEILNLYTQYSQETSTPEYRKDDVDKITA